MCAMSLAILRPVLLAVHKYLPSILENHVCQQKFGWILRYMWEDNIENGS